MSAVASTDTVMGEVPAHRVVVANWIFSTKSLTKSSFFVLITLLQPLIFSTIAFFMFDAGGRSGSLLYAALGAGLMGIWSSTLFGSGGLIQWERFQGTLELLVAAPSRFVWILVGSTLATATVGMYAVAATLFWGWVAFDIPLEIAHPALFALSIPATVIGLGTLGLVLASTFVLYRHANALSNLLEYPVWLITGLLVPLSLLPGWVAPLGWILSPTWGIKALRYSALGGDPVGPLLATLGLALVYLVVGGTFINYFERRAREDATLSLT